MPPAYLTAGIPPGLHAPPHTTEISLLAPLAACTPHTTSPPNCWNPFSIPIPRLGSHKPASTMLYLPCAASLPYCWDPSPIISCAPHAACLPHCWDPSLACTPHTLPMKPPLICVGRKILKHGWCQGHPYLSQQLSDIVDHIRNKLPEPSLPAPRQGPQLWSTPPPVTHAQCPAGRGGI